MRFLVTGGAGFIGSHVAERLLERGDVRVFDNLSGGRREFVPDGAELVKGDLLVQSDIDGAMDGIDAVFHLASNPDVRAGIRNPRIDLEQGVLATFNLLEAMRKHDVRKIVFSSSSTVYGEADVLPTPESYGPLIPISIYGAEKLACEGFITAYCHTFDMQSWIFRFANVIGKRGTHGVIVDFMNKLKRNPGELEILGDGKQHKSYLTVEDCVEGMLVGFDRSDERVNIFNLGTPTQVYVSRIAEIVVEELGLRDVRFVYTGGLRGWRGDVRVMLLDTSKIEALGWRPQHTAEEAVRQAVRMLKEELWS